MIINHSSNIGPRDRDLIVETFSLKEFQNILSSLGTLNYLTITISNKFKAGYLGYFDNIFFSGKWCLFHKDKVPDQFPFIFKNKLPGEIYVIDSWQLGIDVTE